MRLTSDQLLNTVIAGAGREARSYGGRAMYGARCIGLDIERGESVFAILAELTQAAIDADIADEWLDVMANTKSDSMGLGSIIYWPRMDWTDGKPDSDAPTVGRDEA